MQAIAALKERLGGEGLAALLIKGATGSFAVKVAGAGLLFASQMLLTRLLGATQYGIYIYALTWIILLSQVAELGLGSSILRFVATYRVKAQWGLLHGLLRFSSRLVFGLSLAMAAVGAVIVWWLREQQGPEQTLTFWLALALLPVLTLTGLRQTALVSLKHVIRAGIPESIFKQLLIMAMLVLLYLILQHPLSASQAMIVNLLSWLVTFVIGTVWLLRLLPPEVAKAEPRYERREWLRVSLPMLFATGMRMILFQADIIMVGLLLGAREAGIYAVATRIVEIVAFGEQALNSIVAPMISELFHSEQHAKLRRMMTLAAWGRFAFTLVVSLIMALLGEYLLGLFGAEFVEGMAPFLILLAGNVLISVAGSGGFLMPMTGHQNQHAIQVAIAAAVNVVLNAILVPLYGISGAAIATVISMVTWNVLMLSYVWRHLRINPTIFSRLAP